MKISVKNFGAIENASVEMKPLTVFVGENGTGKTWFAYSIAAMFGSFSWKKLYKELNYPIFLAQYNHVMSVLNEFIKFGNAKVDVCDFLENYLEKYFSDMAVYINLWMAEYFNTDARKFEKSRMSIAFSDKDKEKFLENIKNIELDNSEGIDEDEEQNQKPIINAKKESGSNFLFFYGSKDFHNKLPESVINEFVVSSMFQLLHRAVFEYVYTFPTERTTFITFPFRGIEQIKRNQQHSKRRTKNPENEIKLIEPIEKLIRMIFSSMISSTRKNSLRKSDDAKNYVELSKLLENGILQGGVNFSGNSIEEFSQLEYFIDHDTKIDIPIASSMVKELAPFVLCLRYLAEQGELLIIDEPEMNLHPEAQVRFIEFLSLLVNNGLNILITTHSSYFVDHLSNLIRAYDSEDKEKITEMLFLKNKDALIDKNMVSIYSFENGSARNILLENGDIDWQTFSNVSEKISEISLAI